VRGLFEASLSSENLFKKTDIEIYVHKYMCVYMCVCACVCEYMNDQKMAGSLLSWTGVSWVFRAGFRNMSAS
jgi:hypothetical protein